MKKKFIENMTILENEIKNKDFRKNALSRFTVMWTLITRYPLPQKWWPKEIIPGYKAMPYAPAVGAIMGIITALVTLFAILIGIPKLPASWIGIAFYTLSGWAIHLDGWGDLWDGMGSGKSGEELREIIKDSRLGSFGAIGLLLAFGLWTSLVSTMETAKILPALMTSASVARFSMCVSAFNGTYPWEKGLAKGWVEDIKEYDLFYSFVIALLIMPFAPFRWLISIIISTLVARKIAKYMNNRLGGVNGDVLGATEVLCEIITLAVFSI
ncbi:MAG: adenosylcobinamide-GDP ribazoletransferase [Synergistaceae bacterium]